MGQVRNRAEYDRAWRAANPEKCREAQRRYREKHGARAVRMERGRHLMSTYGMTLDDYDRMLAAQGGACATCLRPPGVRALCVDHDHDTGEVRGLLCSACNAAIDYILPGRIEPYLRGARRGVA